MPHTPEEPTVRSNVPGPRNAAGATRTPQASRSAVPVPGPRPGPRPGPSRANRSRPAPGRPGPVRAAAPPQPSQHAQRTGAAPAAPQIQLVAATEATAVATADETVDALLDEGRQPADVLVLTTGAQHPWAQHELSFGEAAYWRQQSEGEDVFCAHALATDRVENRPVVVLAVNGGTDEEAARALPAALAKAKAQLIVCGDPQRLRGLI